MLNLIFIFQLQGNLENLSLRNSLKSKQVLYSLDNMAR